jgi:hypothetical protein
LSLYGDGVIKMPTIGAGAGTYALKWDSTGGVVTKDTSTRLNKKDIVDTPYGLKEVLLMKPRLYKYIATDVPDLGFIAEEVHPIMPELCPMAPKSNYTKNPEDTELIPSFVYYDRYTAVLTKAIQEQQELINQLKARIEALELKL